MKVLVAMSGGVDSSVAAALLKNQGHEVIGATMEIWSGEVVPRAGTRHGCYGPEEEQDIEDARRVAQILEIPFQTLDLRSEYESEVLEYFRREYLSGRTPNPCVRCNQRIKFGALVKKARASGIEFDYFATGHYARVEYDESWCRYLLKRARDLTKDQSYFLFALSQEQLRHLLFPLGSCTKEEVRRVASDFGLGVEDKPESQDFFGRGYASLLRATAKPGPILDRQGNVLGQHKGVSFYTIGQRKRLGISAKEPLYVTDINLERNAIIVGSKEELYHDELMASGLNWIAIERLRQPADVKTKIRYHHQEAQSVIAPLDEDKVYIRFKEPQMAITPGQAVAFYDDDTVIGGGTIEQAGK